MRVLLAVAALVVVVRAVSVSLEDLEFHSWKLNFGKSYGSEEEESQRKMIWLDNLKLVLQHNLLADQGIKTYRLGMNHFADMDNQEYQARFGGCLGFFNVTKSRSGSVDLRQAEGPDLPNQIDWRLAGYVTEVKSQQPHCQSCWAFSADNQEALCFFYAATYRNWAHVNLKIMIGASTIQKYPAKSFLELIGGNTHFGGLRSRRTGALEGQMFRKTKKLVSLSEQQLMDCSREFGNNGCQRGWPHKAFEYVISKGGLEAENTYPYEAEDGQCKFNPQNSVATCRGYNLLENADEDYLQAVVATIGPMSVGVDITNPSFQLYESGVYDEPNCNSTHPNHAVLAVGYGTEGSNKDYWLVKNSWGADWGEKGYIKMSRNKNNQCGIASYIVFPEV